MAPGESERIGAFLRESARIGEFRAVGQVVARMAADTGGHGTGWLVRSLPAWPQKAAAMAPGGWSGRRPHGRRQRRPWHRAVGPVVARMAAHNGGPRRRRVPRFCGSSNVVDSRRVDYNRGRPRPGLPGLNRPGAYFCLREHRPTKGAIEVLAKAIVAVDNKKVEIREVEIGTLGPWDLKVELEASAISVGTESYVLGMMKKDGAPYIPGYAPVARVVEAGKEAAGSYKVGDRVSYFTPRAPQGVRQGCGGHQGTAFVNVDPAGRDLLGSDCYVVKVPEGLSSERAAFGGISAVSCMGVSLAKPNVGDKALVIGQGLIGQFAAQHFHLRGAEVAVADLHDKRLELARQVGADHTINSARQDLPKAVRAIWPQGADIIADSTGNYQVIEASVDAIRYRGKYVFLAWCKGANFNLPRFHNRVFEAYFPWTLQGFRVLSSWRLMGGEALKIDPLITHRFHYSEAQKAYDLVYSAPDQYVGIVFNWRG
jgi:2-desacetyl-2-hydroxyethyl bacteriochlorophyllide A dehydrogenase